MIEEIFMKKKVVIVLSVLVLVVSTTFVNAMDLANVSTGSAIIPFYYCNEATSYSTWYQVSNITDKPVEVTIVLYKDNGVILKDDNNYNTGTIVAVPVVDLNVINYTEDVSGGTVKFSLNPHTQAHIGVLDKGGYQQGHGKISWSQQGSTQQALVVHASAYNGTNSEVISVNAGMPF